MEWLICYGKLQVVEKSTSPIDAMDLKNATFHDRLDIND